MSQLFGSVYEVSIVNMVSELNDFDLAITNPHEENRKYCDVILSCDMFLLFLSCIKYCRQGDPRGAPEG